jgi:hypothetical protein
LTLEQRRRAGIVIGVVVALVTAASLLSVGRFDQPVVAPVIGVQPIGPAPAPGALTDDQYANLVRSITTTVDEQLAAIATTDPIAGGDQPINGELPIETILSLKRLEALGTLQDLGQAVLTKRLAAIDGLRGQVDQIRISYGLRAEILGLLDQASSNLQQLQIKIGRDQLPDQVRSDVKSVEALHVFVVALPQARLFVAAAQVQNHASLTATQEQNFQTQIYGFGSNGVDISRAQNDLYDMNKQIAIMQSYSSSAMGILPGLTPSGYPGNKGIIYRARALLVTAKVAMQAADADYADARASLGL